MEIGREKVFVQKPFIAVGAGISIAAADLSQGSVISDVGAAGVVFKAGDGRGEKGAVDDCVLHQAPGFPLSIDVKDPQGIPGFAGRVTGAQELVAAADG